MRLTRLPNRMVDVLWLALTQIEAQEMLKALTVADWPMTKKARRDSLHRELHFKAFPDDSKAKTKLTPKDLMKLLNGGGHGG